MTKINYKTCKQCNAKYADSPQNSYDMEYGKFCSRDCRSLYKEENPLECPMYYNIAVTNSFSGAWHIVAFNSSKDGFRTIARVSSYKYRRSSGYTNFIVTCNVELPSESVDTLVNAFICGKFTKHDFRD